MERPLYGLGFRTGNLINFYSHSLYWLVRHIGPIKVVTEILKDGDPVIYGELTSDELDRLVESGRICQLRRYSWGVSWPFGTQSQGADDNFAEFSAWRDKLLGEVCLFTGDNSDMVDYISMMS